MADTKDLVTPRERWEAWENQLLAPHAIRARDSRGRQKPEPPDPLRTAFQVDRERILYSKAFRRLKHKTQVLFAPEGDHYRTRMTHTLEVAQIARTIGRILRLNEDLIEAIALGHDLGHTPFGHAGERALDEISREFLGKPFRHYEHSLRVVDILENEGKGLNLTYEVREGILHHSKGEADWSPAPELSWEAQVVRIADRIAYIHHDLDDAFRAGLLEMDDIPAPWRAFVSLPHDERIRRTIHDVVETSSDCIQISGEQKALLDGLKDLLFARVYQSPSQRREAQKATRMLRLLYEFFLEEGPDAQFGPREDFPTRAQKVLDYIAGMTDLFALRMFEENLKPRRWPI